MDNTILIEVTNQKALRLIHELEELNLIKVLTKEVPNSNKKISDKYKGVFTLDDANSFNEHTQQMRNEWGDI
jgi:hypothetical protein